MANEDTDTRAGILKAIKWLRATGRSVIAAKMKRELLPAERRGKETPTSKRSSISFKLHA